MSEVEDLHRILWQIMDSGFRSGERYVYAAELAFLLGLPFTFENEDGTRETFQPQDSWLRGYAGNRDLVEALLDWRLRPKGSPLEVDGRGGSTTAVLAGWVEYPIGTKVTVEAFGHTIVGRLMAIEWDGGLGWADKFTRVRLDPVLDELRDLPLTVPPTEP